MLDTRTILLTATLIEAITLLLRFGLGLEMSKIIQAIMRKFGWKKMVRLHHFFLGLIIAGIGFFVNELVFNLGLGLSLSDVFHHIILKVTKGRWEFSLMERI
jgi:hypothetical protein